MKPVDPLPGGLHSTPEQDALARTANTAQAQAAQLRGASFTPPMSPSQLTRAPEPKAIGPAPGSLTPSRALPTTVPSSGVARQQVPDALAASFAPALPDLPPSTQARPAGASAAPPRVITVQAQQDPAAQAQALAYQRAVNELYQSWSGRPPRTDVILPPVPTPAVDDTPRSAFNTPRQAAVVTPNAASVLPASTASRVLIPAGRGIYAHTVLALSSDASSPVILQADSGPIAGDRMIGSFSKEGERLVIRVSSIVHGGETITAEGIVVAPGSMEAAVASSVDHHYVERFVLPAAAAFVSGLGQAIAQTSNSAAVLSPFGGVSTTSNLNFRQQLGVAGGVAGGQIGSVLNQSAPKGSTVSLEANAAVGVMFLSNVASRAAQ